MVDRRRPDFQGAQRVNSHRIRRLREDHDLEERPAPDEEVTGYWQKALRAYGDSCVPGFPDYHHKALSMLLMRLRWMPPRPSSAVRAIA